MKGHEALIDMRRAGLIPASVTIDLAPYWQQFWRDWHEQMPSYAQLLIEPKDVIHRLDLRFVIGLPVMVQGEDERRVGLTAQACVKAGAARVMAGCGHCVGQGYETDRLALTNDEVMAWPL